MCVVVHVCGGACVWWYRHRRHPAPQRVSISTHSCCRVSHACLHTCARRPCPAPPMTAKYSCAGWCWCWCWCCVDKCCCWYCACTSTDLCTRDIVYLAIHTHIGRLTRGNVNFLQAHTNAPDHHLPPTPGQQTCMATCKLFCRKWDIRTRK